MKKLLAILILSISVPAIAQKFSNLAQTPPMGWNSWNKLACDGINEKVIKDVADAMVNAGMKNAGYQYIVVDDCWQVDRDASGNIVADPKKFPSGIKSLSDYIHSKGLKFGIYSCAGRLTCGDRPGSRGYEFQDALRYAAWGVDYLKYDYCHTDGQNAKESYQLMRDALYKAARPIVFSMCEFGMSKPWEWAQDVSHLWRTTGDIENQWGKGYARAGKVWGGGVQAILDMQNGLEKFAGPGHWNDPDMLEVGNGGLSVEEERSHFSLWCMLAAPLMTGNDLSNMNAWTKEILTNKDVIDIDQDTLGMQGYKILDGFEIEIFMKPLAKGDTAICIFNRSDKVKEVDVNWRNYKLSSNFRIRDLWLHREIGTTAVNFKDSIPGHGVRVFRLFKK